MSGRAARGRARPGGRLAATIALALLGLLALGLGAEARAYPHFQLSSGSGRCSQCHIGPAGGGLLTPWGQDEQGDTIARGGDGHFLHGAIVGARAADRPGGARVPRDAAAPLRAVRRPP